MKKLQNGEPGNNQLQNVDIDTRCLYAQYLHHCQAIFQDVAQDTDEILQVCSPKFDDYSYRQECLSK